MEKKEYKKPTVKTVAVRQQCALLAGSLSSKASLRDYNIAEEQEW